MASLSGQNPSATFPSLIKTVNNNPVSGSLIQLSDGNGVAIPISVSTVNVSISSPLTASIVAATSNGLGTNFKVGDDAWIGDVNIGNTLQIMGQEDPTQGYVKFSNGTGPFIGGTTNSYLQITGSLFVSGTFGQSNINIVDYNQKGGAGYTGFLTVTNTAPGAVTPSKFFRLSNSGSFEIVDSAYQNNLFQLKDNGNVSISGSLTVKGSLNFANGTDKPTGTVTLGGGTSTPRDSATITNNLITTSSIILLTKQTFQGNSAGVAVVSASLGSALISTGTNAGDTSVVAYMIINPA